jgi:putative DNA primase/helicase
MSAAGSTVDALAELLRVAVLARQGKAEAHGEIRFRCPCPQKHTNGDAHPSARYNPVKAVWTCDVCKAGGGALDLAARLGVEVYGTGNDTGRPPGVPATWNGKRFTACWCYRDATGRELGWVARYDGSDGTKDVVPFFKHEGERWKSGNTPDLRPLLGQDVLAAQPEAGAWVTEGEKCAARIHRLAGVAVTSPGGALAAGKADWRPLRGRHVRVWPDRDEAGAAYGADVARLAREAGAASVEVLDVAALGLSEGGDVVDWLAAHPGATLRDLEALPVVQNDDVAESTSGEKASSSGEGISVEDQPECLDTDRANAVRIVKHHRSELRHVDGFGYIAYEETHWRASEKLALRRAARVSRHVAEEAAKVSREIAETSDEGMRAILGKTAERLLKWVRASENGQRIREALKLAAPLLDLPATQLDRDNYLFNCASGTLDFRTQELRSFDPADFITRVAPVEFQRDARCDEWLTFVRYAMGGNKCLVRYLQKAVGYSLCGDIREEAVFFLFGTGANGKSTFLNVVSAVAGPYAYRANAELLMLAELADRHPTEVASLQGARLVICQETEKRRRWAVQRLKEIASEPFLTARKMRQDLTTFRNTVHLWISANDKPITCDTSDAFWRRLKLIPFTVTVPKEKRDTNLTLRLCQELPGILAWALEGFRIWREEGLQEPPEVLRAVEEYRHEADTLSLFLDECCDRWEGGSVQALPLWEAYRAFIDARGFVGVNAKQFSLELRSRGFEPKRKNSAIYYWGLSLRGHEEDGWIHQ